MVSAAFNPIPSLTSAQLIPADVTLENFRRILSGNPGEAGTEQEALDVPYTSWYVNTLVISGATAFFSVFFGALAAYAFARFRFRGRRMGMMSLLLIQMFPTFLAVVAIYLIVLRIGNVFPAFGLDTRMSVILVGLGGALGINTWLMKGFLDSIPDSLDESARVDGATPAQVFWGIILPLAAPVLAVVGLLSFIFSINEFIIASRLLQSTDKFTLPVGLYGFINDKYAQQWGPFCAGVVLAASPCGRPLLLPAAVHHRRPHAGRGQGIVDVQAILDQPHHDGSEAYAPEMPAELGDEVTVLLRVPSAASADAVAVRYVRDGEPQVSLARVDRETEEDVWWRATFPVHNVATPYRWLLAGGDFGYAWLNAMGLQPFDVPDADDFVVSPGDGGPDWHLESVVYEVFPDRFASSGLGLDPPDWAVSRAWDELPTGRGPATPVELFGGDLRGVEERLDHLVALGASVLYLTPIFPAGSTHRYDATTFDFVDPLLGGNDALISLVRAAHARGIRILGDLTTNHVGSEHEWFVAARAEHQPERGFFFFDESFEHGYACWAGVPSLPKLDYGSGELCERMYAGRASVVRRWLEPPYDLDGWRIDVANMTGRLGAVDRLLDVAHGVRSAASGARPDALVVGEHAHDARAGPAGRRAGTAR